MFFMHRCAAGNLEWWGIIFQASFRCFIPCVLMHSCANGDLGRWAFIFPALCLCLFGCVFDAFLRCRGPWEIRSHLPCCLSIPSKVCCYAYLSCRVPWEMRSDLPSFRLMPYRVRLSILRCREPWQIRSHLSDFIWIIFGCVLVHSCAAKSLEDEISSFKL